jgi:hypothetical protein
MAVVFDSDVDVNTCRRAAMGRGRVQEFGAAAS